MILLAFSGTRPIKGSKAVDIDSIIIVIVIFSCYKNFSRFFSDCFFFMMRESLMTQWRLVKYLTHFLLIFRQHLFPVTKKVKIIMTKLGMSLCLCFTLNKALKQSFTLFDFVFPKSLETTSRHLESS